MHKNALGKTKKEIVKQVLDKEESVKDFSFYIPIGNAIKKLRKWKEKGVKISYLTSRTKIKEINQVKNTLRKYKFPKGKLYHTKNQNYKKIIEKVKPDVYIDDDCKSIGGNNLKKTLNPNLKIKVIIMKEIEGIDNLSDNPKKLL